jgi:hypothetical protein
VIEAEVFEGEEDSVGVGVDLVGTALGSVETGVGMLVIEAVMVVIAVAEVDSVVASRAVVGTGAASVVAEMNNLGEDLGNDKFSRFFSSPDSHCLILEDAVAVLDFTVVVVLLTASQMAMVLLSQLRVALVDRLAEALEVVEAIVETSNAKVPVGMMIAT